MMTCTILFTVGLIGILFLSNYGYFYAQKDYFHTSEFRHGVVDEYIRYLGVFELNNLSLKEAKAAITVSDAEIDDHRYRYGDLPEQIESITNQYEARIEKAMDLDDQQAAEAYIAERDAKIEDITKNFESDEHVESKIIKEKEQKLASYYREKEDFKSEFERYRDSFQYYLKDITSGEVYTNLDNPEEASLDQLNEKNMLFVTKYSILDDNMVQYGITGSGELMDIMSKSDRRLEGKIGVPESLSASNPFMVKYENFKREQIIFWGAVSLSIIALLLSLLIFKRAKKSRAEVSSWSRFYNKLPIDVRVLLLGITGMVTLVVLFLIAEQIYFLLEDPVTHGFLLAIGMLILSAGIAFTIIQAVFLLEAIKDWKNSVQQWQESLLYRMYMMAKKLLLKLIHSLKEAFLDQTTGTQLILVFGLIFILGLSAVLIVIHPIFVFLYIILLGVVGIPIMMIIINKIGYFNRIVENTNELAAGNLSKDLDVVGKTAFATLASNINLLKQGVKISQNEQAKSERLKTELITNVSHDLRTPLTSIITYTELLKKQRDISEDSTAYLEIIDRKSKRLKVLIDDLFEVSKMASGNIELKKEKVDLVQLLQQALAEYDDIINESNLTFRVSNDTQPINAVVDGQKLWRVFDNLIGNILKYSLDNSRVYINLSAEDGKAIISFKNVSKYELNENSEELFERFKRGDVSRNTEGSGLGLAIAQSIVDLHQGSLEITTDGDLFKVTISLYLQE